jgi:hypothetical protein
MEKISENGDISDEFESMNLEVMDMVIMDDDNDDYM